MLARIKEKRSAIVCPEIDVIDAHTLAYNGVGGRSVGGFWWSLHFSWRPLPRREDRRRKSSTDPIRYQQSETNTRGKTAFPLFTCVIRKLISANVFIETFFLCP